MTGPGQELQPDPALEERVVSALVAAGLVRRRRAWPRWVAAAAVILLAAGASMLRPRHPPRPARTYVILLYEDSTYVPAPAGHNAERVAVLSRWADSLEALGEFERAGRVAGPGSLDGLFIVRAADDLGAARIAASCPFHAWGGRVEVRRFE